MLVVDIFKELKILSDKDTKSYREEIHKEITLLLRKLYGNVHLFIILNQRTHYFRYFKDDIFRIDFGPKVISVIDINILNLEDETEMVLTYGRSITDNYYDSRIIDIKSDILSFLRSVE